MNLNIPKSTWERTRLACGQRRLVVDREDSSTRGASNHSRGGCAPRFQPSQQGVALIITVILLSVLTLTTLAFLSMSRRERGSVTTATDTASTRLAADAALANAEAQILANALATTNPYNFGLIVSTNYINPVGFQTAPPASYTSYTNVNYYYPSPPFPSGTPVSGNDFLQLLANLYYSPRPPVFIQTNKLFGARDFRFYLDLNRNAKFDTNGVITEFDNNTNIVGTNFMVGDPEWIGILQRPDQPYGPNNPFVARFAFIALPIGNALDLNAIYNQAYRGLPSLPMDATVNPPAGNSSGSDSFIRNEGVGSWEINLAAFLADLNTNQWDSPILEPYQHLGCTVGSSFAFDDARALLAYRYANNFNTLVPIGNQPGYLFGNIGINAFSYDYIDGYTYGRPLLGAAGFDLPTLDNDLTLMANHAPWSGADNTNHFFDMQELFNTNETAIGVVGTNFTQRLQMASNSVSTYDRYTFYRLLSQLGTDSAPEQNKMNLNYRNVTNGVVVPNLETNFYPWTAIEFFTNAADRMLRDYSQEWLVSNPSNFVATFNMTTNIGTVSNPTNILVPFGIANIPVLVSNRFVYTPAVQRVLQLTANIYDATTNNTSALGTNFPSVFRPIFWVTNENNYTNVYIDGYEQVVSVTGTNDLRLALPVNVTDLLVLPFGFGTFTNVNVYGVPWIIGAKKGFPNFNEFSMESIVGVTRRLQVTRLGINPPYPAVPDFANFHTNQMYTMSISNLLGVECWNSYTNNYVPVSGNLNIVVNDTLSMVLTNDAGMVVATGNLLLDNSVNITSPSYWPGSPLPWTGDGKPNPNSFDIPLLTNVVMQLNPSYASISNCWAYRFDTYNFLPFSTGSPNPTFEQDVSGFPFPHFGLLTTNRLQVFMLDGTNVIDYVQFAGPNSARDLNAEIFTDKNINNDVWITNTSDGVPDGILNQISISRGQIGVNPDDGTWHGDSEAVPLGGTPPQQQAFFDGFFQSGNIGSAPNMSPNYPSATATNLTNSVQAPYNPTRYVVLYTTWQANDPLVHYIASDLNYTLPDTNAKLQPGTNAFNYGQTIPTLTSTNANLGQLNNHYKPWGRSMSVTGADPSACNPAVKDPLVWLSDDWDFPTNKFPTVGWLGRVHRGTPWQTVYLKAMDVLTEANAHYPNLGFTTWADWSGDFISSGFDATNSAPVQDRLLFDLFTTAFNDNATRGQLSVNVGANDPNNPQAGLAAWSALFSGVIALSNNAALSPLTAQMILTGKGVQRNGSLTNFTAFPINPAGVYAQANPPPLWQIVTNINQTRANFVNANGLKGAFEHIGGVLAAPALTAQSPFLNADAVQKQDGISDEMYEWLPQQVMSLLRVGGSPQTPMRYVIYSYGQTLKPAPNSIYTGNTTLANGQSAFGMVTNYQVVSETATRAVVRFNSTLTNFPPTVTNRVINNNAVIESFNVLPPD